MAESHALETMYNHSSVMFNPARLTEIGLTGQSGPRVHKFVMAGNKQDSGSAITQLHFMAVKTARAIREIQGRVTFLNVQMALKKHLAKFMEQSIT